MFFKKMAPVFAVLLILFVSAGDRVLPQPLSGYSVSMRTTVLGWLPKIRRQNYNEKTEDAVNDLNN